MTAGSHRTAVTYGVGNGPASGFVARCRCGWQSALAATEVFAQALAEQHRAAQRRVRDEVDAGGTPT